MNWLRVNVTKLDTVKELEADISSASPSSEQVNREHNGASTGPTDQLTGPADKNGSCCTRDLRHHQHTQNWLFDSDPHPPLQMYSKETNLSRTGENPLSNLQWVTTSELRMLSHILHHPDEEPPKCYALQVSSHFCCILWVTNFFPMALYYVLCKPCCCSNR